MHEFFLRFDWLAFSMAIIAGVVWLVRLEGRVNHQSELLTTSRDSVDDLRRRHEDLGAKVVEKLSAIETGLARLDGYLKAKKEIGQ